jgi:preprotein translocase subunit SecG
MSKVWKWILGIVIVLVVVGAIAGVVFLVRTHLLAALGPQYGNRFNPSNGQNSPNAPTNPNGQRGMHPGYGYGPGMRGYNWEGRGPMMGGRGFMPYGGGFGPFGMFMPFGMGFFFLGGLLRLLIPIGVLVLVAYIFYQMGKRNGMSASAMHPANSAPVKAEGNNSKS